MFKKLSLMVVALVLMAGSVMAGDAITAADLDVASISDADNTVVEANLDVDVDALTGKTSDKGEQAVEACFRRFGWGGCYGGYNYCYSPCYSYCYYPSYSYCYQPCYYNYYVYRPCYTYSYCSYPLYHWGCY
ncbi:MAG: hypothetical protein L0211_15110 [Planctomycetaceae bacterium]|nr:hypothetical protein [Planctomycetaceae bacterium]